MVQSTKDPWSTEHLLEMIDKGKNAAAKEPEPEWNEPMPDEVDLATYLKKLEERKADASVQFKPMPWPKFVNAGVFQTLSVALNEQSELKSNALFIVGQGRSGTTLLYSLV